MEEAAEILGGVEGTLPAADFGIGDSVRGGVCDDATTEGGP